MQTISDDSTPIAHKPHSGSWSDCAIRGTKYYYVTTLVVVAGVWIGTYVVTSHDRWQEFFQNFMRLSGEYYVAIARDGYSYRPGQISTIAYFPAYPLLGRCVSGLTGLSVESALLLVSHLTLLGAFVVQAAYCQARWPDDTPKVRDLTLLSMGLWPSTLFFRMGYSESLFLLITLLAMYGMQRKWPATAIALIVGFATATRPVGVALVPVFGLWIWQESVTLRSWAVRSAILLPISCWGCALFMAYQQVEFENAMAFTETLREYVARPTPLWEKVPSLLTLRPIWSSVFDEYWSRWEVNHPLLTFRLVNPLVFVLTAVLVAFASWRRWLNSREALLGAMLLLIPYVTMACENLMVSQARFAAVVFPAYFVMGRLLARLPSLAVWLVLGSCAVLLGIYSVLFAAGYGKVYHIY